MDEDFISKKLMKAVGKTRTGRIPIGLDRLAKSHVDKTAMHAFHDELLKIGVARPYPGNRDGTTTDAGVGLKPAVASDMDPGLNGILLSIPGLKKEKKAEVSRDDALDAVKRLNKKTGLGEYATNATGLAAVSPIASATAKAVAAGASATKGHGLVKGVAAFRGALNKHDVVEKAVGGALGGTAMTAVKNTGEHRQAKRTLQTYLESANRRDKAKLQPALEK